MKNLQTKIDSGIYKGKWLKLPNLATTRSTKSLVKSSFFNSLRYEIAGRYFIEGFGGSGVMALEALSNGAKAVFAVEKDKAAFEILKQNFSTIDKNQVAIFGDCFIKVVEILKNLDAQTIIYLDPPFEIRDGFENIYDKILTLIETISHYENAKIICIEHMSEVKFQGEFSAFKCTKVRKFGATTLTYLERK